MTKCRLFPVLLLMTVLLLSALLPPAAFRASAADADVVSAFEQQNVMDDLDGMTIDGKAFDVKDYALQKALSGTKFTGFKVVEGRSNRKYADETAVAKAVEDAGYEPYEKKLLGITAMSQALGRKKFEELLGGLVYKPPGKPVLVPESDKRPAINTAINDFKENEEDNNYGKDCE